MKNSKSGCEGCGGCNKKNKPVDCNSDGCGRCCGGSCSSNGTKEAESQFMVLLLERYYLPVIISEARIIYTDSPQLDEDMIVSNDAIIRKFESQGYLTIDTEELDEYSYLDYEELLEQYKAKGISVKKGTLAVTKYSLDTFLI